MNGPFETGSLTVDCMSRLQISGNVIPVSWYKTIRKPTGKPNLNAIIILADIVYWSEKKIPFRYVATQLPAACRSIWDYQA